MKKSIVLVLLFSSFFGYTQNYKFNTLTKYNCIGKFPRESVVYSNTENLNYFLYLKKENDKTIANLFDLEKKKYHTFKVVESKDTLNQVFFQFIYLSSKKYIENRTTKKNAFKFETKKNDSLFRIVKMSRVNKSGKVLGVSELKIKNYPYNLFPIFRFSCLHPYELASDININETGIVESFKKANIYFYLDYFKKVNFELNIL